MKAYVLRTAFGVVLSILIVAGGWFITDGLLIKKENALLSARGGIPVNAGEGDSSHDRAPAADASEENLPILPTGDYPKLNASEIYAVLDRWTLKGTPRPHEPTVGQLNMEQAIGAGEEWLTYFCQNGLIPTTALRFRETNAYLSVNIIDETQLLMDNPRVEHDNIREETLLEPFYSYWTVSFKGPDINVTLTINAGTGQVWRADIESNSAEVPYAGSANELLAAFTDYIDTDGTDGIIDIIADVNLSTLDGEIMFGYASLSLYPIY
jgi:hypothetical protein